jgi:hypothetical protein
LWQDRPAGTLLIMKFPQRIVALMAIASLSASAFTVEPASADKVRDLMDKVAKAQARVASLRFKCVQDYQSHSTLGFMTQHITWEVLQRGALRSAARDAAITVPNGPQQMSTRAVLNDEYFAMMMKGTQMAQQYLHDSRDTMCDKAKTGVRQFDQLDLLAFGYGDRNYRLSEWQFFAMPALKWHVEVAGEIHKVIGVDADTGKLSRVWSLDASKDFFIIAVTDYQNDKVRAELIVDPVKLEGGIYLPAAAHEKIRAIGMSAANLAAAHLATEDDIYMQTDWVFSDIKVNPPIGDSQFTIGFLHLAEGSPIVQRQLDGSERRLVYRNGAAVEEGHVPQLK